MSPRHTCQRCAHWRETGITEKTRTDSGVVEYHMGECWLDPPRVIGLASAPNLAGQTVPVPIYALPSTRHSQGCSRHSDYQVLVRDPISREFNRPPTEAEAREMGVKVDDRF